MNVRIALRNAIACTRVMVMNSLDRIRLICLSDYEVNVMLWYGYRVQIITMEGSVGKYNAQFKYNRVWRMCKLKFPLSQCLLRFVLLFQISIE